MGRRSFDQRKSALRGSKLSIIVPVFNEASRIADHLELLINEVEGSFADYEIIAVSDGSTDGTDAKLRAFQHPGLKTIIFERNSGKGNAVRSGFERASGDYILFIDGGMEIHPKEIRIFVGLMELYECDIVVGSKRHPQSQIVYPWYRRLLSSTFQMLIRKMFKVNVTDTQVGIKLFRRDVIQAVLPHLEINRYGFDLEILSLARLAGFGRILEVPIRLDYFHKTQRFFLLDLWHVVKVGFSLMSDTLKLYRRLQKITITPVHQRKSEERKAG